MSSFEYVVESKCGFFEAVSEDKREVRIGILA